MESDERTRLWPAVEVPTMAGAGDVAPPELLLGRYRVQRLVASGGMGTVWEAVDESLRRPVAVKVLQPRFAADAASRERFRVEACHAARLNHPAVATVYDWFDGDAQSPAFLVMEYVDGGALSELLQSSGRLPPARVAQILAEAASALAAAHAEGLVHRDVKPANVLLTSDGRVKLTDFGISRALRSAGPPTADGVVLGTPFYLAPEQGTPAPATAASDVYALGVVGYEMLAGRRPFEGDAFAVLAAHRRQQPPPLPAATGAVGALVMEMLAKAPGQRPSAAQVAQRARVLAAAPVVPAPRRAWPGRRVGVWIALPVLALAGIASAGSVLASEIGRAPAGPAAAATFPSPSPAGAHPAPASAEPAAGSAPALSSASRASSPVGSGTGVSVAAPSAGTTPTEAGVVSASPTPMPSSMASTQPSSVASPASGTPASSAPTPAPSASASPSESPTPSDSPSPASPAPSSSASPSGSPSPTSG